MRLPLRFVSFLDLPHPIALVWISLLNSSVAQTSLKMKSIISAAIHCLTKSSIKCFKPTIRCFRVSFLAMLSVILVQLMIVRHLYVCSSLSRPYVSGSQPPINTTWSPRKNHCDITGVYSWKRNIVTVLQPRIKADCRALSAGDVGELTKVKEKLKTWKNVESEAHFLNGLNNCSHVVEEYFNNFYVSPEEERFPLAYILVVYTDVWQVLRLLKVIYRPQNLYCIHPDAKQGKDFMSVFLRISYCLSNVFVASKLESVYYAHHTLVDAQLNCMQDLLKFEPSRWKYTINLCGRELPLMTNREIVQTLMKLNGSSAIDSFEVPKAAMHRFVHKVAPDGLAHCIYFTIYGRTSLTWSKLGPVPYGIKLYKASNYMAITRPLMSFFLTNEAAIALREYMKDVVVADEHFYASLHRLQGAPGGPPKMENVKMPNVLASIWVPKYWNQTRSRAQCKGWVVHDVCVVGSGDLPMIYSIGVNAHQPIFFFNKYFMEWDHVVMDCMEQRLVERNKLEHVNDCPL